MNINRINHGLPTGGGVRNTDTPGGGQFQQLLETHMRPAVKVEAPSAIAGVTAPAPVDPAVRIAALELSERAINELEDYQKALGNLELKPDDIEPHVAALEERVIGLLELREQIPADDSLAVILDRVCTSCYLETVKFRRGDYSS